MMLMLMLIRTVQRAARQGLLSQDQSKMGKCMLHIILGAFAEEVVCWVGTMEGAGDQGGWRSDYRFRSWTWWASPLELLARGS